MPMRMGCWSAGTKRQFAKASVCCLSGWKQKLRRPPIPSLTSSRRGPPDLSGKGLSSLGRSEFCLYPTG
ncbi:hypothetical protein MCHI_000737 [Candidatus Magnetoovum chiemensis]|nr:hypothetical protein MCHI_000737 [Candidatus Magnetoovum chiemensis]